MTNRVKTILLEGNLAVGKTMFLDLFEEMEDNPMRDYTQVIREPVDKWTNYGGVNLLNLFYRDPSKYAFLFESQVFLSMADAHLTPMQPGKTIRLMERSLFSAQYVFAKNLFYNQYLDVLQSETLTDLYDHLRSREIGHGIDQIVHLYASPEVLLKRIQKRGRPEESQISLMYLQQIEEIYKDWVEPHTREGVNVITWNTEKGLRSTQKEFKVIIKNLLVKPDAEASIEGDSDD